MGATNAIHDAKLMGIWRYQRFDSCSPVRWAAIYPTGASNVDVITTTDGSSLYNSVNGGAAEQGAESTDAIESTLEAGLVTAEMVQAGSGLSAEVLFGVGPATAALPTRAATSILGGWRNTGSGFVPVSYSGSTELVGATFTAMQRIRVGIGVFSHTDKAAAARRSVVLFRSGSTDTEELHPIAVVTTAATVNLRVKALLNRYLTCLENVQIWKRSA